MKSLSPKFLTLNYLFALSIIAILTIASHFILEQAINTNHNSAALINISGRQRMLSQRIVSMAAQYELGDRSALAEIKQAIDKFENSHYMLSVDNDTHELNDRLHNLYYNGSNSLNRQTNEFIKLAKSYLTNAGDREKRVQILNQLFSKANSTLLVSLDKAVLMRQQESEARFSKLNQIQWGILSIVLFTLLIEALAIFRPMVGRISRYTTEILKLANYDTLTNTHNRRSFFDFGNRAIQVCAQNQEPCSLLMLDIDHFKLVNDTFGHAMGDAVLKNFSNTLKKHIRKRDILGRLGGEEFAILLPGTDIGRAQQIGEELRRLVSESTTRNNQQTCKITVSIGAVEISNDMEQTLLKADRALYKAKEKRNTISLEPEPA